MRPIGGGRRTELAARKYDEWLSMPGRLRAWYLEANAREAAPEDVGHYLFQWREEHVPAEEIRRRIFAAAAEGKP